MNYNRGGGYWAWKPAIIWETLQNHEEGDIVVYVDAGCTLRNTNEWNMYFNKMKEYNTICYQYKDEVFEWASWGQSSTKIKYWTKRKTREYFEELTGDILYGNYNKIMGGFILCKGKENVFIKHWLDITLKHPELIIDPTDDELKKEDSLTFHKHDQTIITPLAHLYNRDVLILPEKFEFDSNENSVVITSRFRVRTRREYLWEIWKRRLRFLLGDKLYDTIKKKLITYK
jgi:hypothetical protein